MMAGFQDVKIALVVIRGHCIGTTTPCAVARLKIVHKQLKIIPIVNE